MNFLKKKKSVFCDEFATRNHGILNLAASLPLSLPPSNPMLLRHAQAFVEYGEGEDPSVESLVSHESESPVF